MSVPEQTPPPVPSGTKLPGRAYLWFVLGLVALFGVLGLERVAPQKTKVSPTAPVQELSGEQFRNLTLAETQSRSVVGLVVLEERRQSLGVKTSLQSSRRAIENQAIAAYRKLLPVKAAPSIPRRLLILEHLAGKPLDETLLAKELSADLRERAVSNAEIQKEIAFWRGLYDRGTLPPLTEAAQRLQSMELGSLKTQALYDLYRGRADDRAEVLRQKQFQDAVTFLVVSLIGNVLAVVAFLAGLFFLFWYGFRLFTGRLPGGTGDEGNEPSQSLFGDLMEGFAFYFALLETYRFGGALLTYALPAQPPDFADNASTALELFVQVLFYALLHLGAVAYVAHVLKRRKITFAEIGLTGRDLWKNVGYGIAGYCAALPLVVVLGLLSQMIFQNLPDTTPNEGLLMLLSERSFFGRFSLFLLIAVLAPLFEEFFFRGVLLTGLRSRFSRLPAVLVTSLLFALGHPMQDWLSIFGLGLVFGILRDTRQSLVPSMTAHFLQNSVTYFALVTLFP